MPDSLFRPVKKKSPNKNIVFSGTADLLKTVPETLPKKHSQLFLISQISQVAACHLWADVTREMRENAE